MTELVFDVLYQLAFNLAKGAGAIFQRDSYLYWPYLVSSIAIALIAWRWFGSSSEPRKTWEGFFSQYFSSSLWWHRSARADYQLYLANALIVPLLFAVLLIDERHFARLAGAVLGVPEMSAGSGPMDVAARLLFTVLFFIAYDFGRFVVHCLLHEVPILWEFHKVHHSAEVLTPMTSFRAHPLELLLMAWGPVITTGALALAFNALAANSVSFYSFLGVHVLLFVSNLIGNLRHSPVWISYGPVWGRWLISPAHHQLHHSCEQRHLGCNRGFELAVWDRLYGTLYVPGADAERFTVGLGDGSDGRYHHLGRMYLLPFFTAGQQIRRLARRSTARLSVR